MPPINVDAAVGGGGGGTVRAALVLAVSRGTPIMVSGIRVFAREPGLRWPHLALIHALANWTESNVSGAEFGSTTLVVEPGRLPSGHVEIDLDDPSHTCRVDQIQVTRDPLNAYDAFLSPISGSHQQRAARGHSVVTPLLALLPLVEQSTTASATLRGGTETPGAPFVDAVRLGLLREMDRLGAPLALDVLRRGCIGVGGGEVNLSRGRPESATSRSGELGVHVIRYTFGGVASEWKSHPSSWSVPPYAVHEIGVPYPTPRTQILALLVGPTRCRDVSVCAEEIVSNGEREELLAARIAVERGFEPLVSRYVAEHLILWCAVKHLSLEFATERATPHLMALIKLVDQFDAGHISVVDRGEYVVVRAACE